MHGAPHMPAQNAGIYGARMILFRPRLRKIKADRWATAQINDTLGHSVGSALLRDMADLLTTTFRDTETIGRIGGDEFIIAGAMNETGVRLATGRLERAAAHWNLEIGRAYPLSFSLGHVTADGGRQGSLEELMSKADAAMYIAKRSKKLKRNS